MLNQMILKNIHTVLEGYDRKLVKCKQIRQVREEKHYEHKELLDIYLKLAAKYNAQVPKQKTFSAFVEEYKDKLDEL